MTRRSPRTRAIGCRGTTRPRSTGSPTRPHAPRELLRRRPHRDAACSLEARPTPTPGLLRLATHPWNRCLVRVFLVVLRRHATCEVAGVMPTLEHNAIVEMFRERPELAPEFLASLLHVDVPPHVSATVIESALDQLV